MNPAMWELFLEAAEMGSFGKVALARGTSQPHISRQIGEMEAHLGSRLFLRTGRGVVLTALGQRIAPQVRAWLASTEHLENEIMSSAATPLGRVRLGILPSLAHPFTSELFQRLRAQFPQVELSVREGQGAQLENWLEDGSLDLALVFRHGPAFDRDALALSETQTYLIGQVGSGLLKNGVIPFEDLDEVPIVMFCRPSRWREMLEQVAREKGIKLNVVLEADSLGLQIAIAAEGIAYGLLGEFAIAEELLGGKLQSARVVDPEIQRHIAMALPKSGQTTPATRAVMDVIRDLTDHKRNHNGQTR